MRVILVSKNFAAANPNISHIGLGVAGLNTCKVLIQNGIPCEVWQVTAAKQLRDKLKHYPHPITHVVISAPWISTLDLQNITHEFPHIHFAMNCHSNVGFLQADPQGMRLLKEDMHLEMAVPNFSVAANSTKMQKWIECAYGQSAECLPNLYYLNRSSFRPHGWNHTSLRIGCFGATRPQKNLASSIGAAIQIGRELKVHTDIFISSGRAEGGGNTVLNTVNEMVRNLPAASIHETGWQSWPAFRQLVGSMHLLLQPSYTESFNMVTADGIAEGVPSVLSSAIDWAPPYWVADADDVNQIARVGQHLLRDPHAPQEGYSALENYIQRGIILWKTYLQKTLKPC